LNESTRGIRQQLESHSLAGLTHIPRGKPPIPGAARAGAATAKPSLAPAGEPAKPAVGALAILAAKVRECTRCAELAGTRTQTVFGVGNPVARIVFIGEAPGADEDAQGEPFVGRAGQLLNQIITASRLTREEVYICNVLKCRPPGNRTPADDECANCREYLDGQLAAINPEYIVCWGAVAARNLLKSPLSIGKLRGKLHEYGRAKVLCTYHPSYLLRNPAAKKDVWQDMQFLMADMGVDLKGKP
jgi:uracil-DNA glycosylase family 4